MSWVGNCLVCSVKSKEAGRKAGVEGTTGGGVGGEADGGVVVQIL